MRWIALNHIRLLLISKEITNFEKGLDQVRPAEHVRAPKGTLVDYTIILWAPVWGPKTLSYGTPPPS